MRKLYVILVLVLFFAGYAFSVSRMEKILTTGDDLLLPLAPVDPRALLMGDYMDLDYALNREIWKAYKAGGDVSTGCAVVKAQPGSVSRAVAFARFDDGAPLGESEYRLRFTIRDTRIISAAPAFYFQEGQGRFYEAARYGRVKARADGKTVLVALCDETGRDIVVPAGKE